jgi:multidrug efflux pump
VNFTAFFIKNPVWALVLNVMSMVVGFLSLQSLSVREYPQVSIPAMTVIVAYDNASPEVMESVITMPLEDELAGVERLEKVTSRSYYGYASVNLTFLEGTSSDKAIASVRDALSRVRDRLPHDVHEPVIYRHHAQESELPLVLLSLESETLNTQELSHFANLTIKNAFRSIEGVSSVEVWGDSYVTKVKLDPQKMHLFSINAGDVYNALREEALLRPVGKFRNKVATSLEAGIKDENDLKKIVIKTWNSAHKTQAVFLKDISTIEVTSGDQGFRAYRDGKKATFLAIKAASDANPVEVSNRVHEEIQKLRQEISTDFSLVPVLDQAEFVREALKNAGQATLEAISLVILLVFLFLRSGRATLVPIVTIPLSLMGAVTFLKMFGFSLNIMTLLAMVLAVGLVVDDAIVVLENISRHIEKGLTKKEAALQGTRELGGAIIAMTLTLVSVYLPFVFVEGAIGQLFLEFAVALAGSVLISGFVALTLSPLMCSRLLRPQAELMFPKLDEIFKRLTQKYATFLTRRMEKTYSAYLFAIAFLGISLFFLHKLPQETAPTEDRGMVMGYLPSVEGKDRDYYEKQVQKVAKFFEDVPEKRHCIAGANQNDGVIFCPLCKKGERTRSSHNIAFAMEEKVQDFTAQNVYVWSEDAQLPGVLQSQGSSHFQIVISTNGTYQELYENLEKCCTTLRKNPLFSRIRHNLNLNNRTYKISVDPYQAAKLGLTKGQIANTLEVFFSGNRHGRFEKDGITYPILIETEEKPWDLSGIYLTNVAGQKISLDVVAQMKSVTEPSYFFHYNQMRSATLNFHAPPGEETSDFLKKSLQALDEHLPKYYKKTPTGEAASIKNTTHTMASLFVLAIVFIFAILSLQFNNFRDPLIILLGAPLACAGALLGLWLMGLSLNIYTAVGLITLVGLIAKHGILILAFTNQRLDQGEPVLQAIHQAMCIRLRPILMTTGAMFLGSLPLCLPGTYGSESRQAIGVVLTYGLFLGTLFMLLLFPPLCKIFKKAPQQEAASYC